MSRGVEIATLSRWIDKRGPRTAPCKCYEGLVRIEGVLQVCPECKGTRAVIVSGARKPLTDQCGL